MVHVDADSELSGRVGIAADLADRFHAHLIGIAGWAPISVFLAEEARIDPTVPELQDMKCSLDRKGEQFCAAVGKKGRQAEWRSVLDFPTEAVAREARAADLVIIGNERENRDPFRALDPGSFLLKAGRPVLVVPRSVTSLSPKRIAIAWKDVREARRAVQDSLPLLQQAESVVVVEISETDGGDEALHHLKDVANYLTRHRIDIVAERVRPADIYGHSRLGEWAYGGVTRELLAESPICCLFSH
jgi:nucleotide-binding universal stress UspA family protein